MPMLIGLLGDAFGLKAAMHLVFLLLGFILSISFWANPIVRNETIQFFKRKKQASLAE